MLPRNGKLHAICLARQERHANSGFRVLFGRELGPIDSDFCELKKGIQWKSVLFGETRHAMFGMSSVLITDADSSQQVDSCSDVIAVCKKVGHGDFSCHCVTHHF